MIIPGIIASSGSRESDPYWDQVVLAMHMDGVDNGTVFTDLKGHTVTPAGNTVTKTGVKKYGTASAYFDGTGDYLAVTPNSDMDIGTADFCIEFWIYLVGTGGVLVCSSDTTYIYKSNGQIWLSDTIVMTSAGLSVLSAGVFHHLALTRQAGECRFFIDGILDVQATSSKSFSFSGLNIGRYIPNNNLFTYGYIDDLRITKGVARYTADFMPPSRAFPNQ